MSSSPPVFDVPRRISLATQTAAALRKAIADGVWSERLPGERYLCQAFQVSRPTLRAALHQLARDGLVEIRQGCRNRLRPSSRRSAQSRNRVVGLITQENVAQMPVLAFHSVSEMRAQLAAHGFALECLVCPPGGARAQERRLEEFVRANRLSCCALLSVGREVQTWFARRSLPALVLGSCHPEVALPSLGIDYRAICLHAAAMLLRRGHQRLAFLVPDSGAAGDLASEEGFLAAARANGGAPAPAVTVVRHEGTAQDITARLDVLFRRAPPTALLVAKPRHVFMTLMYLLQHGLSVPARCSVIARDRDPLFVDLNPPIDHYTLAGDAFLHRLTRLMRRLVAEEYIAPEPNLMLAHYVPGGTVQPPGDASTWSAPERSRNVRTAHLLRGSA